MVQMLELDLIGEWRNFLTGFLLLASILKIWFISTSNQDQQVTHWKMSSHENHSRMRIKLIPNDEFTDHMEASRLRDTNEPAKRMSFYSYMLYV